MAKHKEGASLSLSDIPGLLPWGWGSIEEIKYPGPRWMANRSRASNAVCAVLCPMPSILVLCLALNCEPCENQPLIQMKRGICLVCDLCGLGDPRRTMQSHGNLVGERQSWKEQWKDPERLSLAPRLWFRSSTQLLLLLFWLSVTSGKCNSMSASFVEMIEVQ